MQCYQKLIENLENRIGKHSGRISNINQLIDLYGKEIWQVTCPRILRDNTIHDFANCFYGPWTVGKIYNIKGKEQKFANLKKRNWTNILRKEYFLSDYTSSLKYNGEKTYILSLIDYNVLPFFELTNSALFLTKQDAQNYMMFIKLRWPIDEYLSYISNYNPNIFNGTTINENEISKVGLRDKFLKHC